MPQADLKFSNDIGINTATLFPAIEATIARHDPGAGDCKCRAYPAAQYHHTHVLLSLMMLAKPHRDAGFTHALMADIETLVKSHISQPCAFSFSLTYNTGYYVTNQHDGANG